MTRESVVCPGCSCLCDDLDVTLEAGRIAAVANVCQWGAGKFLGTKKFRTQSPRDRLAAFEVSRNGTRSAVSYEEALEEAATVLGKARRPLIYGLTGSGSWAQAAALKLARQIHARLEPADLAFMGRFFQAVRSHGLLLAPLEVIRDEADTILFWGANPLHAAPRSVVRYGVFARGRFTERGLEDRRVAAVDIYRTELAHFCNPFVVVQPAAEEELLTELLARLHGRGSSSSRSQAAKLHQFLTSAVYGAIFVGRGLAYGNSPRLMELLAELAVTLNGSRPFAFLPLPGDFNSAGLYHLLLRECGHPGAPDFRPGAPPQDLNPVDFQEVDAILVTGADLWWFLPADQAEGLARRRVPVIVLSPFANRTTTRAQVLIPVALDGVEAEEEAYRLDWFPLRLKAVIPSPWPPAYQVLEDLSRQFP